MRCANPDCRGSGNHADPSSICGWCGWPVDGDFSKFCAGGLPPQHPFADKCKEQR